MKKLENENKALNKTDVKCRFFAQYWGQKYSFKSGGTFIINERAFPMNPNNDEVLELKQISNITDKECCELFDKFYPNAIKYSSLEKIVDIKTTIKSNFSEDVIIDEDFIFFTDYMRGKGYALPFMNYSVDELVKMGWVQLV